MTDKALRQYLSDHWMLSQAGVQVARRALRQSPPGARAVFLARLVQEIEEDRSVIRSLMKTFGATAHVKTVASWFSERLSVAGDYASRALGRSAALHKMLVLETLLVGTEGRLALWQTLNAVREMDPRLSTYDFQALVDRTTLHREEIERHRLAAAHTALREEATSPANVQPART
jgi:hypothetical protein